ncbi:MAG: TSUP family transporter [Alphaproteobacteria bacterium]|nr:TSUP family transporter [Alphaproteobacteria bacterium]
MPEWFEALVGPISTAGVTLVVGAILFAGFLRGFVGFGAALIIVMVLSVVLGPLIAVPIANLAGLPATLQLLPTAVRESERSFVIPFCLATFLAAPVGAWILISIDPAMMRMVISAFVLAMVAMLFRGWQLSRPLGPTALAGAGAAAGLVQGSAGVSGPMAVVVALSRPGTAHQQRANVIGTVTALNFCGLAPFWYHGLFTREVILISLMIIPLYSASIWFGARFFTDRGHRHFRNAALLSLAIIGVTTMILAVRDYLAV